MAKGFPLLRPGRGGDFAERVIHFMLAERHPNYATHLKGNADWEQGQFFAGLDTADPNREKGFEEIMIELRGRVLSPDSNGPEHVTYKKLKIGCERFGLLHCL